MGTKNYRKAYILDAARKDDYVGGPGDEESNSGVSWNQSKNLYKKADSSPHSAGLSVNHILDKVRYHSSTTFNPLQGKRPSYAGSVASFRSGALSISSPTELKEIKQAKKQRFWDYFSMVCSISYGIFIVVGSVCMYATDLTMSWSYRTNAGEIWNLALCSIGILLLLFLCFDIRRYMSLVMSMHKGSNNLDGIKLVEGEDGELHIEVPMQKGQKKHVPEYYGFTSGR